MAGAAAMKPCVGGASRCFNAASALGENFSGLFSRATIMVASARTSRFSAARATSSSTVPFAASCNQLPDQAHQVRRQRVDLHARRGEAVLKRGQQGAGFGGAGRRDRRRLRRTWPLGRVAGSTARRTAARPLGWRRGARSSTARRFDRRGLRRRRRRRRFGAARRRTDDGAAIAAGIVPGHHRRRERTLGRRGNRRRGDRRHDRRDRLARVDRGRRHERQVKIGKVVGNRCGRGFRRHVQRLQRIVTGGHVRIRGRIGQRGLGQRIAACAGLQAEQAVERIAAAGAGCPQPGYQCGRRRAADVEAQAVARAGTGTPGRRRAARHRVGGERIPVFGNAADGSSRCRRARGARRRSGRLRRLGIEAECGQRVRDAGRRPRTAPGRRALGAWRRQQAGERIVGGGGGCGQGALHRQHVAADLQPVALRQRRLAAVADVAPVDLDRVAAAIDHRVAAGAEHDLCMHPGHRAVGVFEHELVGVGAADGAAQFVEGRRGRPGDRSAIERNDGQGDHAR